LTCSGPFRSFFFFSPRPRPPCHFSIVVRFLILGRQSLSSLEPPGDRTVPELFFHLEGGYCLFPTGPAARIRLGPHSPLWAGFFWVLFTWPGEPARKLFGSLPVPPPRPAWFRSFPTFLAGPFAEGLFFGGFVGIHLSSPVLGTFFGPLSTLFFFCPFPLSLCVSPRGKRIFLVLPSICDLFGSFYRTPVDRSRERIFVQRRIRLQVPPVSTPVLSKQVAGVHTLSLRWFKTRRLTSLSPPNDAVPPTPPLAPLDWLLKSSRSFVF